MNCQEIRPYLEAFSDQELSPDRRTLDVERHVAQCESCQAGVDMSRTLAIDAPRQRPGLCCPTFGRDSAARSLEEGGVEKAPATPARVLLTARDFSIAAAAAMALLFGAAQRQDRTG